MKFESMAAFIAMGGHGSFVWSVYAITLIVLVGLAISPIRKNRRFWSEQVIRMKREQGFSQQSPDER